MAGPQFLTPQPPVQRSRSRKVFTLREANRALPLVKRVVADIVRVHGQVAEAQARLTAAVAASQRQQQRIQQQLAAELGQLQDYIDELTDIGCELKDCEAGLVDFVGRHQGREVYLCWKLGEEQIGYFHELRSGFAGRMPVSLLEE